MKFQLHCSVLENALKCPVFCPKENLVFFEGNSIFLRRKIIFLSDKILALRKSWPTLSARVRSCIGAPQYRPESFEKNRTLFPLLEQLADEHHATASQVSLAWMMNKRPPIVPIPGTRHLCRLKENIGAADIYLTDEEVKAIDTALDNMEMSEVFGGSPMK